MGTPVSSTNTTDIHDIQCRIYHCAKVCLSTGPRWPGGGHFPAKTFVTMNFCLCGAILNLKAFLNFLSMYA